MGVREDMLAELDSRNPLIEESEFLGQPCVLHGLPVEKSTKIAVLSDKIGQGTAPRRGLEHPLVYTVMHGMRDDDGRRIFRTADDADKLLKKAYLGELSEPANKIADLSGMDEFDSDEMRDAAKNSSESD